MSSSSLVSNVLLVGIVLLFKSHSVLSQGATNNERLVQEEPACDEILESWTREEVRTFSQLAIQSDLNGAGQDVLGPLAEVLPDLLTAVSSPSIKYGVTVRKICGSCDDIDSKSPAVAEFCSPEDYGSDIAYSGLLMQPMDTDGSIAQGTFRGFLYMRPTKANSVPSNMWRGADTSLELFLAVLAAASGKIAIAPDFMGYGESSQKISKAYIINKSYHTSVVPLIFRGRQIVSEETDCKTALANDFGILGYSEGGYAALSVASVLNSIGLRVNKVFAGGAPLNVALTLLTSLRNIEEGRYSNANRYNLALFGSAYSSTYEDLTNFGRGQDLLSNDMRDEIVEAVFRSSSISELHELVPPGVDMLTIFNDHLTALARPFIEDGNVNAVCDPENVVQGLTDKLCEAAHDNTLTDIVENARFKITLCHSPDDETVDIGNLPEDISSLQYVSYFPAVGDHSTSGLVCLGSGILTFLYQPQLKWQRNRHKRRGCDSFGLFGW